MSMQVALEVVIVHGKENRELIENRKCIII